MMGKNAILELEKNEPNLEVDLTPEITQKETEQQKDDGFIDFTLHRVYITEPPHIENTNIDYSSVVDYLSLHFYTNFGEQFEKVMRSILLFHDKKVIEIPSVKTLYNLSRVGLRDKEINMVTKEILFDTDRYHDCGTLFYSLFRNHYEFIQGLGYLGLLLDGNELFDKTKLTYEEDLDLVLALIAYSNAIVPYSLDYKDENPMYYYNLPKNKVVEVIKEIVNRVILFKKRYDHDNAIIPFGNKALKTNLARFMYQYRLPVFSDFEDDHLSEDDLIEKQQQMVLYHQDLDRMFDKYSGAFIGQFSVVYNPLINKMFVWDYSRERITS